MLQREKCRFYTPLQSLIEKLYPPNLSFYFGGTDIKAQQSVKTDTIGAERPLSQLLTLNSKL